MNKLIFAVLALLIAVSACTTTDKKITENSVITIKNYGAFSPVDMATQLLTIDKDNTVLRYYDGEGRLTKEYTKKTDSAMFLSLISKLQGNKFLEMEAFYTIKEGQPAVTDVGTGEITVEDGQVKKTVKIDPYFDEYMPEGLKEINTMLGNFRMNVLSTTEEEAKTMAESWIKNSKTYKNGGSGLKFLSYAAEESYPEQHLITYEFTSSHAGYGETKVAAQVITNHKIVVTIFLREVIDAVIDGKWDEISQAEITQGNGFATFTYQPKQCEQVPWMKWKDESLIMWAKEPTEEEVVVTYFGSLEIDAVDFQKVESGLMVCEACNVCPTSYFYTIEAKESDADKMQEIGWARRELT